MSGAHRRFFDIDDLAGVRQEDPEVFEQTHRLALRLVAEGVVDGLRIDHPDGLADPSGYLARLREAGADPVWVEKILETSESLRDWPVAGTVGYEFLNQACGLFVDPRAKAAFTTLWETVSGDDRDFEAVALEAKTEQAQTTFQPEVQRLARLIGGEQAITLALASMPIYRTYIEPGGGGGVVGGSLGHSADYPPTTRVTEEDRRWIERAQMPGAVARRLLLEREAPPEFVVRFQQTTPPVVAKGVEDTAFYRYARLLALCDVGGDPGCFGLPVETFHAACRDRVKRFPLSMLTTTTHDTKRTADVRARIAALTWIPADWEEHVRRWLELTEPLRSAVGAPDDVERYFLFQTLAGAWPIELDRIQGYMEKALREAKRNSSWVDPNPEWERDVLQFCAALYDHMDFLADFEPFVDELSRLGDRVALGMLALKLTTPGIPDTYQGDELDVRALVDPDNRRSVDWGWYRAMLARLQGGSPPDRHTAKLYLTMRLLALRIRRPEAFAGDYQPLETAQDCVAFLRGDEVLVAVATRAETPEGELGSVAGRWRDVLRGERRQLDERVSLRELLGRRGVGVFERERR